MAATTKTSKQAIQQELPTQSSDTALSEQVLIQMVIEAQRSNQEQMKYTRDFFVKMIDAVGNLSQITSNLLNESTSDIDDNSDNCDPRVVITDDSSPQQQRFKQSYPKLRPIN